MPPVSFRAKWRLQRSPESFAARPGFPSRGTTHGHPAASFDCSASLRMTATMIGCGYPLDMTSGVAAATITIMLRFTKMNGAGNDFILFDNRTGDVDLDRYQIAQRCDRH